MRLSLTLLSASALALAACGEEGVPEREAAATADMSAPAEMSAFDEDVETEEVDVIAAAVTHESRPEEDVARDEARQPAAILNFAGLRPGMTVLEMEAGSGYYTEIMARVIGPDADLIMQNPPQFRAFYGDAPEQRVERARLDNVMVSETAFDQLDAADSSIDLVTWILGPHEIWFDPNGEGQLADPELAFAEIARVLRPGGHALMVDHIAAEGAGEAAGNDLHRIEPEIIEAYAEAAGLTLVEESEVLMNDEDPLTDSPFADERRGRTSRFVHLYRKEG